MIDNWFLQKLKHIVNIDQQLKEHALFSELIDCMEKTELLELLEDSPLANLLREAKICGFSDFQIAHAINLAARMNMEQATLTVRQWRKELGIMPRVNQIDTLAAEYPAQTNYLYLTFL